MMVASRTTISAKEARRIVLEHPKFKIEDMRNEDGMLFKSIATWYLNSKKRPPNDFLDDLLTARPGRMTDSQYRGVLNTFRGHLIAADRGEAYKGKEQKHKYPWRETNAFARSELSAGPKRHSKRIIKSRVDVTK